MGYTVDNRLRLLLRPRFQMRLVQVVPLSGLLHLVPNSVPFLITVNNNDNNVSGNKNDSHNSDSDNGDKKNSNQNNRNSTNNNSNVAAV